ncbi:hypothetical protein [Bdellovibrio sp. HCB-110]|uniref:hypothetical protein n=1 Tax=Bdellovibrio sp. HCB-110 TaxID=3391182 RepID=UPI0039B4814A
MKLTLKNRITVQHLLNFGQFLNEKELLAKMDLCFGFLGIGKKMIRVNQVVDDKT